MKKKISSLILAVTLLLLVLLYYHFYEERFAYNGLQYVGLTYGQSLSESQEQRGADWHGAAQASVYNGQP
ncbi:hypothetical protein [Eremococcus coleocola]|uniref:Uncharacterized protein n=1 Tax=Eremococcus coleocola ACS-139-V-Col8 TaxID=908337 RepID=E4KRB2_9LACT|nr:hypothetical protein [Eremococcus coleocola]EFR30504.1 hypothetical protein HMPREF9257_0412 [Eremococcus coleocola ACS-139-V-Col8]